jgi:cysteine-rich repeat protein
MKATKSLGVIIAILGWAIFLVMPNNAFASPLFSLETSDDWAQAPIVPVLDDYPAADEVYRNTYGWDYDYSPPELYVYEGDPGFDPPLDDAGLVMVWGDSPAALPQLAAWEYVYDEDPNLIGTTLTITVTPPMGIWAVSLTLNDAAGGWNTWDWYVATPGNPLPFPFNPGATPLIPNVATTITLDPTIAANQSGSNVFVPNGFNPAIAISIQADELSAGGGFLFLPNPITGTPQAWNYWSNLSVTGPLCGDGFLDPLEECDDGNNVDGDGGCNANCVIEFCGDGILQPGLGEQCDDGNNQSGDGCNANCILEICGNGTLDSGEECDDGNNVDGDGCNANCVIEFCGDGILQPGLGEQCDDGNNQSGDGCDSNCLVENIPPDIQCNAPATITPQDTPISFSATATDNCTGDPFVEIIGYDCFRFSKKGKRIDKTMSCIVEVNGDTITIVGSGGTKDNITWTVRANDNCGNVAESTCSVVVVKP